MTSQFRLSKLWPQRLRDHQVSVHTVLKRGGLPEGLFQQEKVFVTTGELFAFFRAIGESSDDPAIGLKLGAEQRLERYDPAAIAAFCSKSLRDAIARVALYKQITCPEEIRVQAAKDTMSVEFAWFPSEEIAPYVLVDVCLSWIHSMGHRGTEGKLHPLRVEFTRPVRAREIFESHFGCKVEFKTPRNLLIFRSSDLDLPFVSHNADLLELVGTQLAEEIRERELSTSIEDQIKRSIKRSLAGRRPALEDVAQEMRLSDRTLQRRLTDAGLTFQKLVEDTRREMAQHYLKQQAIELNETAYLLGYEDANSFFRAFHQWEGITPGEWRKGNLSPG